MAVTYAVIWLALLPVWLSGGDIQDGSPGRRLDLTTDRRVAGPAHQPARGRYHFHGPFPVADLAHTIGAALPFFLVGLVLVFGERSPARCLGYLDRWLARMDRADRPGRSTHGDQVVAATSDRFVRGLKIPRKERDSAQQPE
ncbi:hypothetical protein Atai01_59270 [Amycolatopsis taiwanensis]|uniref:Uncharacterized protein n=1 Tax=Amycolatopsis taiwanensis TaxID=342230 RepID=A0A9W6VF85_9PSEU|nr:hypothetical protein Atai01_59270 [Amycolatopsis taiwanensis]